MTKARTLADNFAADINGITAGTGITGGGTSGTVTITNDMATAINAKGDLVVGTGADAYSRLAVASTAGYLLTVDSAEATGLKWAAPAGGLTYSSMGTVATEQTTTSTTFTDLSTVGPSVTVTTGTTAIVVITSGVDTEASGRDARIGVAVSGASSISAASTTVLRHRNDGARSNIQASAVYVISGLTAGSNTFTLKYASGLGGTVSFVNRNIFVIY